MKLIFLFSLILWSSVLLAVDSLTESAVRAMNDMLVNPQMGINVPMNPSKGYLAPPLLGIWATAPYLHNGSVPTLWDLLNPAARPSLWKAASDPDQYDLIKVGMAYEFQPVIKKEDREINTQRSLYYDTRMPGHSNVGHPFANKLSIEEKRDLLEYLKTL